MLTCDLETRLMNASGTKSVAPGRDPLGRLASASIGCTVTGIPAPVAARFGNFAAMIAAGEDAERSQRLRRAETIGRPLGNPAFLAQIEAMTGRTLRPGKPGPRKGES